MSILKEKGLIPIGGQCTCFSKPYAVCSICAAVREQQNRWASLTVEERRRAIEEYDRTYPSSNQDGR